MRSLCLRLSLACCLMTPPAAFAIVGQDEAFPKRMSWIKQGEVLKAKQEKLTAIKRRLKGQFVNIDEQIDRLVDILATWYMLPQAQVRPLIVNLWGMTGVGKTSLVRAVVKELEMESIFAEVDVGELVSEQRVSTGQTAPHPLFRYAFMSGKPMIWMFDEFHTARTVDERGMGVARVGLRPILKLLSDGMVPVPTWKEYLMRLAQQMFERPEANVYVEELPFDDLHAYVYPDMDREKLRSDLGKKAARRGMANYMLSHIPQFMPLEKTVDFRRTLVINAGNLDEAFRDVTEMDPLLMSADEFHEASKLVTVRRVKESLVRRFKVEEIARLGNTHIIYPSFSRGAFRQLIALELARLSEVAMDEVSVRVEFTPAVMDLLYSEGVIPSQGARPPLTTVTDLVGSQLTTWLVEALVHADPVSRIVVTVKDGSTLVVTGSHQDKRVFQLENPIRLTAGDRLKVEESPLQERIAYREAAKAVVGMFAKGALPISIYSKSSDASPGGSVRFPAVGTLTRRDAFAMLQIYMAPREIEKIKYEGLDGTSVANAPDVQSATELTGRMVQDWGMGGEHVTQSSKLPCSTKYATYDAHQADDGRAQERLLCDASAAAAATLEREKNLLNALGAHLSRNATITRPELLALIDKHARDHKAAQALIGCGTNL